MFHNTWKRRGMFLLAIVWLLVIFGMSAQAADDSGALSGSLTWYIVEAINRVFSMEWDTAKVLFYTQQWEYPIRKMAHMSEYAILAWILTGNFVLYKKSRVHAYVWAGIAATGYAVTDEIHQLFVPGRAGLFSDVCVDAAGAVLGLVILRIIYRKR